MRALPAGPDAVLLDFTPPSAAPDDQAEVAAEVARALSALSAARDAGALPDIEDLVPGAATLLVTAAPGRGVDMLGIHRALRAAAATATSGSVTSSLSDRPPIEIPVHYDGDDLSTIATELGVDEPRVVDLHRRTLWRVQFMGFAPGFGYLVPHDDPSNPLVRIGRRAESRTRVPAGAVAVAAGYSAIYPRSSPGGWHLLGHTDITLWDETADPPALLTPGRLVRFVDIDVDEAGDAARDGDGPR